LEQGKRRSNVTRGGQRAPKPRGWSGFWSIEQKPVDAGGGGGGGSTAGRTQRSAKWELQLIGGIRERTLVGGTGGGGGGKPISGQTKGASCILDGGV